MLPGICGHAFSQFTMLTCTAASPLGADDLAVEIVERERFFRQVQAVGFLDLRG